jgi:hypothetical protein
MLYVITWISVDEEFRLGMPVLHSVEGDVGREAEDDEAEGEQNLKRKKSQLLTSHNHNLDCR